MRVLALTAVLLALVGCGPKPTQTPPAGDPSKAQTTAITRGAWKPHTSNNYGFKVNFPWGGDPIERPFLGSVPNAVAEICLLSADKWSGNNITYTFTIIPARFKNKTSAAEREEAMNLLFKQMSAKGMSRRSEKNVTWAGTQAKETLFETEGATEGEKKPRAIFRQLITDYAAYIGYIRDDGELTPQEIEKFYDCFELLPRPGVK